MDTTILSVISVLLIFWTFFLSVIVFRMVGHYNRLTEGISAGTLKEILDKLLEAKLYNKKQIQALQEAFVRLTNQEQTHFQRLGIVRFNPFSDTGGSQSFTLALLDGQDNGIIMTSLYARMGNRWYIKHIQNGKGVDVDLSREEQTAIKQAKPVASTT